MPRHKITVDELNDAVGQDPLLSKPGPWNSIGVREKNGNPYIHIYQDNREQKSEAQKLLGVNTYEIEVKGIKVRVPLNYEEIGTVSHEENGPVRSR